MAAAEQAMDTSPDKEEKKAAKPEVGSEPELVRLSSAKKKKKRREIRKKKERER